MFKKKSVKFIRKSAFLQIHIIILASFAFAFLISQANLVSGADESRWISISSPKDITLKNSPLTLGSNTLGVTGRYTVKPGTHFTLSSPLDEEIGSLGELKSVGPHPTKSDRFLGEFEHGTADISPEKFKELREVAGDSLIKEGQYKTKIPFTGKEVSGIPAHLVTGISYAVLAISLIQLVGNLAGLDSKLTNSLSIAAGVGIVSGYLAKGLVFENKIGINGKLFGLTSGQFGFITGVGIAAAIFFLMYKKEEKQIVKFECLPWQAPLKGLKCEECNKDPNRPCTEYRCKSLGQACELENKGTGKEICVYKNVKDVKSPTITPWKEVLLPEGLDYEKDTNVRPPAVGVKIISKNARGCLPAFTPLQFGITTDEPTQCKIDFNITSTFDQMQYLFGESNLFAYNHTQKMRLPAPDAVSLGAESPIILNGGKMTLFVRCMDPNGNFNPDAYAMSFCVDSGPDTTPPLMEEFSIPSGSYIQYNKDKVPIELYTNEPAECKWSIQDKTYETMENQMNCLTSPTEINANLVYTCKSELLGIKNREDNTFYFRCKDNPGKEEKDRNVNVKSKPLILKGSQPLTISHISPNGTIQGSTDFLQVELSLETTNGAEDGKAICSFGEMESGKIKDGLIKMFETNSIRHSQILSLTEKIYTYALRCIDAGGNIVESSTSFNVKTDKNSPKVTRAYRFNNEALRIITNEDAECVYSLNSCNYEFEKGIQFIQQPISIKNAHLTEWKENIVYYVKCRDLYGNQPDPSQCSLIASASQISKGTTIN